MFYAVSPGWRFIEGYRDQSLPSVMSSFNGIRVILQYAVPGFEDIIFIF